MTRTITGRKVQKGLFFISFLFLMVLFLGRPTKVMARGVITESSWGDGDYYLDDDKDVKGIIYIDGNATLHGNGHTLYNQIELSSNQMTPAIFIVRRGTLTLDNVVVDGLKSRGAKSDSSICVIVKSGASASLTGGSVVRNSGRQRGDGDAQGGMGIYGESGTNIYVSNGTVTGNHGSGIGTAGNVVLSDQAVISGNERNGVSCTGGTVIMWKGTISSSTYYGVAMTGGTFNMYGGDISGDRVGVYLNGATSTLSGGNIHYFTDQGVMLTGTSTVTTTSVHIYNNDRGNAGSCIAGTGTPTINCHGGTLENATDGINCTGGTIDINSGPSIQNNKSNGVYSEGGTVYIKNGGIHNNVDGVELKNATLNMTGGSVYSNSNYGVNMTGTSKTSWTGGRIISNSWTDIYHNGADWSSGLVIQGSATSSEYSNVYLNGKDKYITSNTTAIQVSVTISDASYQRGKWLVHHTSKANATTVYGRVKFADKRIDQNDATRFWAKRAYGTDVVVWDKYTMTSYHYRYNLYTKNCDYMGDANKTTAMAWYGDKYKPAFSKKPSDCWKWVLKYYSNPNWIDCTSTDGWTVAGNNSFQVFYHPYQYTLDVNSDNNIYGTTYDNGARVKSYDMKITDASGNVLYTATGLQDFCSQIAPYNGTYHITNVKYRDGYSYSSCYLTNEKSADLTSAVTVGTNGTSFTFKQTQYHVDSTDSTPALNGNMWFSINTTASAYTLTFNANTPTDPAAPEAATCNEASRKIHYGAKYGTYADGVNDVAKTLPTPTLTGYEFTGWYTEASGGAEKTDASIYETAGNSTLYAHWNAVYNIAYMSGLSGVTPDWIDTKGGSYYSTKNGTVTFAIAPSDWVKTENREGGFLLNDEDNSVTVTGVGWSFDKDQDAGQTSDYYPDNSNLSTKTFYENALLAGAVTTDAPFSDFNGTIPPLSRSSLGIVNLYRVWDYGPVITAPTEIYYTLAEAQNGTITADELLSHGTAYDEEDGDIPAGINATNSFQMYGYAASDFTYFTEAGSVTETYRAEDSAGNLSFHRITVHVVDTEVKPIEAIHECGITRFINEYYYGKASTEGGLDNESVWMDNTEYRAELEQAFHRLKNGTPETIVKIN